MVSTYLVSYNLVRQNPPVHNIKLKFQTTESNIPRIHIMVNNETVHLCFNEIHLHKQHKKYHLISTLNSFNECTCVIQHCCLKRNLIIG